MLRELRVRLVAHVHRRPLAYDDQTPMGEVISRCTADVDMVETLFSAGVADVATNLGRLATAREADRVIVLNAGRLVETGTPKDVLRRRGRFAALVELEAADWDWRL